MTITGFYMGDHGGVRYRKGLGVGLTIVGFGLFPIITAPLANWLITTYGLRPPNMADFRGGVLWAYRRPIGCPWLSRVAWQRQLLAIPPVWYWHFDWLERDRYF
ncbi:MAG: hypothetical protein ACK421_09040 [Pseudanabaenaceae cyanobacterium]